MGSKPFGIGQFYRGRANCFERGLIQLDETGPLHEIKNGKA